MAGPVRRRAAMLLLAAVLGWSGGAAAEPDLARGEELARKHCTVCHVVDRRNRFGGIGSTPSFALLAGLKDGRARFESFFARLPHPSFVLLPDQKPPTDLPLNAPPVRLTYEDVAAITAFAMRQKRE